MMSNLSRGIRRDPSYDGRFFTGVLPLGATCDELSASFSDLANLVPAGIIAIVAPEQVSAPAGFEVILTATLDQMTATPVPQAVAQSQLVPLGAADFQEMSALAELLGPHGFAPRSLELGRYLGVRIGGRLVAMAGERLRLPGFTEIASVCTDPVHRGRGYASALIARLSQGISSAGATPFLHVDASNRQAINVYRRLDFVLRRIMHLGDSTAG
jgi:predicted GNAT family acetyltransferase